MDHPDHLIFPALVGHGNEFPNSGDSLDFSLPINWGEGLSCDLRFNHGILHNEGLVTADGDAVVLECGHNNFSNRGLGV